MSSPLMLINAPLLAAQAAAEEAGTGSMAGTMGGAAGPVTAILPPSVDDIGTALSAGFAARGAETEAMLAQLVMVRGLFAGTVASSGLAYTAMDGINEAIVAL
jgi:hypothetical protein